MDELLSTRVQRNWGTDHVYLTNAELALIWEDITGKKTVDDRDIENLKNLITLVVNNYVENKLNGFFVSMEQTHINSDNHARICDIENCGECN